MTDSNAQQEHRRRLNMWHELLAHGGPSGVAPALLRELGIYGGAQGVWVDKMRTASVSGDGSGATVGLLHTGASYADDLSAGGVLYHYPKTNRPPGRDKSEINATKAAGELGLPVFIITYPAPNCSTRDVYLGWIEESDDDLEIFLISFGEQKPQRMSSLIDTEEPFELVQQRASKARIVDARPSQQRFKFQVLQRYGVQCAVCGLDVKEVLDAAHIRPKEKRGSDDPRNGLVLCAVHHRAFDAGLFAVEPGTLRICYRTDGPGASTLRITRSTLAHLTSKPHDDALTWAWQQWRQPHV